MDSVATRQRKYSLIKTDSSHGITASQRYTAGSSLSLGTVFLQLVIIHIGDFQTSKLPKNHLVEASWYLIG